MDRIKQGTPVTLVNDWRPDGVIADPGTVTVTITREDGTEIVTDAATVGTGATARAYNLLATHTQSLDTLTAVWTSTEFGTDPTVYEVCGDFLFTIADARLLTALSNTSTYPSALLAKGRTAAETALEDACHVAFVPRYFSYRLDGNGKTDLLLPNVRPLTVASATIDGSAVTVDDLILYEDGRVYLASGWTAGRGNVVIRGTWGYPFPPPRVGLAALKLAKYILVDDPNSDRATSMTTQDGTTQFLITAGVRQAVFSIPECNAVVDQYGMRDAFSVA